MIRTEEDGRRPRWPRRPRRLGVVMALVGLGVGAWGAVGVPARATYGARVTADEPQYLLTAISLWEDLSLDISDELREQRWRDFHEAELPVQTEPMEDGSELSPHDPLLPVLLAGPVALGGATGAKLFLSVLAGVLAALLVWTAVRRFHVEVLPAAVVVVAFGLSPPIAAYATQVYPELPAALVVTIAVAAITAPRRRWTTTAASVAAVVALPWLSVKYSPVALALAACLLWSLRPSRTEVDTEGRTDLRSEGRTEDRTEDRTDLRTDLRTDGDTEDRTDGLTEGRSDGRSDGRTDGLTEGRVGEPAPDSIGTGATDASPRAGTRWGSAGVIVAALAACAVAYLALHRAWYGGWTVYAAGDHFVGGELDVVGTQADYLGRTARLVGLILDRDFGLAAWGPVILLAVPALAGWLRRRPPGWPVVTLPLLVGWLNATFVALTMHGYWWPGRQVVVVMPAVVLVAAWWVGRIGSAALVVTALLGLAGVALWSVMLWQEAFAGWALVIDVDRWANPVVGAWRRTLPDYRDDDAQGWVLQALWLIVLGVAAVWAWGREGGPDRPGEGR